MIFLQETKCSSIKIEGICKNIGKRMKYTEVEGHGEMGGLATFWNPHSIHLISAEANRSYISLEVQIIGEAITFICTNVYSPPKLEDKLKLLNSLSELHQRHPSAKEIFGDDFNMITTLDENKGGIITLNRDAEAFKNFIHETRLVDILPKTGLFTWNNKRGGDKQIASRLDRFLIVESILMEGIIVESDIIPCGGSDHWPVTLDAAVLGTPKNRPFRFERFWLSHPYFLKNIKSWWQEPINTRGTKMYRLQAKLRHIKACLKTWNHEVFGNIFKDKKDLENQLTLIHTDWLNGNINQETINQEQTLMQKWNQRCQQEEILWKQKSRNQWLKEGEKNTQFFHRSTMDYRCVNKITSLRDEHGNTLFSHQDISSLLVEHFIHIATEPEIDRTVDRRKVLNSIPQLITEDQNISLNHPVTLAEVEEVVKDMPNGKDPGLDGFTIDFFKACWEIVQLKVWEVVEDSRKSKAILRSLNSTFISLILKEEAAKTPSKF